MHITWTSVLLKSWNSFLRITPLWLSWVGGGIVFYAAENHSFLVYGVGLLLFFVAIIFQSFMSDSLPRRQRP